MKMRSNPDSLETSHTCRGLLWTSWDIYPNDLETKQLMIRDQFATLYEVVSMNSRDSSIVAKDFV